nr:polynucleotide adenylyltransferase PcnB [Mycoavidus sp. B2-EB]
MPASNRGAKQASHKKPPVSVPARIHQIDSALISRHALRVTSTLQQEGYNAFIVGGAVRDLLLGVAPKDFDVATDATPEQVQKLFRRARLIGRRFQIVHVPFGQEIIEVSTFRASLSASAAATRAPLPAGQSARARRGELDHRLHAIDASGRVLRDNLWGQQHEDAARRDFTINAMYYDPATQTVLDYHHGMADIRARLLRMIGDPVTRYREDPVRMLRVVRFAAKLGFEIEEATGKPISSLAELLGNVPSARLFDETLKLLLCGQALDCLRQLRATGLHDDLLPMLDTAFEHPQSEKFITLALSNTDERIRAGKYVSASFLFAALLWHEVREHWQKYKAANEYPIPALHRAMDETLYAQMKKLAIQRRHLGDMKEIWGLQPRLEKRGNSAFKLLEHPRFRAAYDFLLLRCESGELDPALAQWWTAFIAADSAQREALLTESGPESSPRRRRRRGRAKPKESQDAGKSTLNPVEKLS